MPLTRSQVLNLLNTNIQLNRDYCPRRGTFGVAIRPFAKLLWTLVIIVVIVIIIRTVVDMPGSQRCPVGSECPPVIHCWRLRKVPGYDSSSAESGGPVNSKRTTDNQAGRLIMCYG